MNTLKSLVTVVIISVLAGMAFAADQTQQDMMADCGMMTGGFMWIGTSLLALVFIALVLAIAALVRHLFFKKS